MALESSQRELQDFFKPHPNPRSEREVMDAQIPRVQTGTISRLLLESPGKKCHSDVASAESYREYYKGEGGGFPRVWAVVSQVSPRLPVACPNTKKCAE
jgi:hypothetical protein